MPMVARLRLLSTRHALSSAAGARVWLLARREFGFGGGDFGGEVDQRPGQAQPAEKFGLCLIPAEGIRITDLAGMAGMTKQALGEFADWLEGSGFVCSQRDDDDRRVRRLFRTGLGDQAVDATQRAIAAIEARWRQEIGAGAYDTMKQALRQLGHDVVRP